MLQPGKISQLRTKEKQYEVCIAHAIAFLSASRLPRQNSYLSQARRQVQLLCKARQKSGDGQVEASSRGDHYLAEAHAIVESLG